MLGRTLVAAALASACDSTPTPSPAPTPSPTPAPAAAPEPAPTEEAVPEPTPPPWRPRVATVGPTREFSIEGDRAVLGGQPVTLWGIRWGNALMSQAVTERHVRNLDNLVEHGINLIGVYVQGSNGGWPDAAAGRNGYEPDGTLRPDFADRLTWLVREADARGMVVMVGLLSPRKDQELRDEAAVKRAIQQTATLLKERELRNVFVDIMHEYNHRRIELPIFREPGGEEKKARLTTWFHEVAPDIEVGVCPTEDSNTGTTYPGMDVTIIQKEMDIPATGFVANVEMQRHDPYDNEGKFEPEELEIMRGYFEDYRAADNAVLLFHSAFSQGITGRAGTGPHPEIGGSGRHEDDRGIAFYFEWVRDEIGRWEYPRHVPVGEGA